jgi:hypothetical protein
MRDQWGLEGEESGKAGLGALRPDRRASPQSGELAMLQLTWPDPILQTRLASHPARLQRRPRRELGNWSLLLPGDGAFFAPVTQRDGRLELAIGVHATNNLLGIT